MSELVRAKHETTGHVAALPAGALELGMCPGWVQVDGPVPSGPKVALDLDPAIRAAVEQRAAELAAVNADGETPPGSSKSADTKSAEKKE
ncbi:hypothetical protein [Amycolatopsis echigonensis]|uniref:Uncharacterized protein n=1 Tax=Amycolatopsis echigonensis TaxID=2576905 RepID=A0A8E1W677_9PSEU|nr:hypothetical protein [Amycolatopsis echigonensis]MBB2504320.1 hypothetical protein [Amycolatopsis echigonensis]